MIAQTAYQIANKCDDVIVGENTDLLIRCLSQNLTKDDKVYIRSEPKSIQKEQRSCWDIKKLLEIFGPTFCMHLLFVHDATGRDA